MNHQLTIRWTGEGIKKSKELVKDIEILALPLESDIIGYQYDQCDGNWEPVWKEDEK